MTVVAIDGPSGSGKSTVARAVGLALGLPVLETGAMYRAVTLAALVRGLTPGDGDALATLAGRLDIEVGDGV
ncbi:MAG TPA: (d)CMP kinase, partial [Acidimicrobiia bacterium]